MDNPLVSVIIPTHKTDNILGSCIQFIQNSTYHNFEIIVVDEGLERSAQRNIGMKRAKGDYFLILDSDQLISPKLIEECVAKANDGFETLYIPEKIITKGFFGYLRNWERGFYTGTAVDVVRFVRSGCPEFDEELTGPEDSDWDRRVVGNRAVTVNHLSHLDNVSFIKYFQKKAYYCKSMKRFKEKNPNDKVLNFWWRCFGVYLESGKYRRVLKRPDLFICLMAVVFIRGGIYLCTKAR